MRKFLAVMILLVASVAFSAPVVYDGTPKEAAKLKLDKEQAQTLKAKGDQYFEEAAALHPQSLCRAWYYWNAACYQIGKRNSGGDWAYDVSRKENNQKAVVLLDKAQSELDHPDKYGCTGADADTLELLIKAVRRQIDLHP